VLKTRPWPKCREFKMEIGCSMMPSLVVVR
jgi:hypothetical protein